MYMAKITEKMIVEMMGKMKCDREEAIDILKWDMEDEDYVNEEAEAIQQKAKDVEKAEKEKAKKPKGDSLAKVKTQKAKKKEDTTKAEIMAILEKLLDDSDCFNNPQKMTASKFTFTDKDGNYCSISMTKHKARPDGYKEEETGE